MFGCILTDLTNTHSGRRWSSHFAQHVARQHIELFRCKFTPQLFKTLAAFFRATQNILQSASGLSLTSLNNVINESDVATLLHVVGNELIRCLVLLKYLLSGPLTSIRVKQVHLSRSRATHQIIKAFSDISLKFFYSTL